MFLSPTLFALAFALPTAPPVEEVHPHVAAVRRYRQAAASGDVEALRAVLAPDSRIWFGERKGEGMKRTAGGKGPWAAWDETFASRVSTLEEHVESETVRTVVQEINDWYLLVERPASRYQITYWLDDEGRIAGQLIHPLPGAPAAGRRDRLDEFKAWAKRSRPGLLDRLLPEGEIDPSQAIAWRDALRAWREEAGLFDPLAGPVPRFTR